MPTWLSDVVGAQMAPLAYYALVAAIVIALVFAVLWIARKALGGSIGPRARGPRLAVMDITAIDPKRKLVLVRRDDVEHLLLIGGQNDLVVEGGILRASANARTPRTEPSLRAEPIAADRAEQPVPIAAAQPARQTTATAAAEAPVRPAAAAEQARRAAIPAAASPLVRAVPRAPLGARVQEAPPPVVSAGNRGPAEDRVDAPDASPSGGPSPAEATRATVIPAPAPGGTPPVAIEPADRIVAPAPEVVVSGPVLPPVADPSPATARASGGEPTVKEGSRQEGGEALRPPTAVPPLMSPISPQPAAFDDVPLRRSSRPERPERPELPPRERLIQTLPRVSGTGGTEPVRRPLPPAQTVQPMQPRSMATPTYPVKSTFQDSEDALPRQDALPRPPAQAGTGARQEMESLSPVPVVDPVEKPSTRNADPVPTDLLDGKSVSQPLASKPGTIVPPQAAPMGLSAGTFRPFSAPSEARPLPEPRGDPRKISADPSPAADGDASQGSDGEKKPLSVRSFATAIQSRPSSLVAPPVEAPPPARTATPPREPDLSAVFLPEPAMGRKSPSVGQKPPEAAPTGANLDLASSLEEFLSAELDSDFGEDIWKAKEEGAEALPAVAPDVRVDPVEAKPAAEKAGSSILSMEEEMERLLGDFDAKTSDRKSR